mmetsp:Transcript_29085/g.67460  ORF Transcript_29085/g.67460 Transcript_29085/m.67460 type:complete len:304 (-) Transcript_29085:1893-2804(-)
MRPKTFKFTGLSSTASTSNLSLSGESRSLTKGLVHDAVLGVGLWTQLGCLPLAVCGSAGGDASELSMPQECPQFGWLAWESGGWLMGEALVQSSLSLLTDPGVWAPNGRGLRPDRPLANGAEAENWREALMERTRGGERCGVGLAMAILGRGGELRRLHSFAAAVRNPTGVTLREDALMQSFHRDSSALWSKGLVNVRSNSPGGVGEPVSTTATTTQVRPHSLLLIMLANCVARVASANDPKGRTTQSNPKGLSSLALVISTAAAATEAARSVTIPRPSRVATIASTSPRAPALSLDATISTR